MTTRTVPTSQPAVVALSHIVLRTANLDKTIEFYGQLVGMKVNYRSAGGAALSHDGEHHRIALASVPAADQNPFAPGLEHVAFKMRSVGDLLGNYKRLRALEIMPFMTIHHGGTLSAYYLDPDGVQVETFVDTAIMDLSIESMGSDKFAKNPIGVPIEFDDVLERFESGESLATLLDQPELQEGQLDDLIGKIMTARASKTS
jgi:catechol 2,3-dioxygenase-like lactoylglutathione lyase family enzyme